MRVRVIQEFQDKFTKIVYSRGAILNISEERFDEILRVGKLVEKIDEEQPKRSEQREEDEKELPKKTAKKGGGKQ